MSTRFLLSSWLLAFAVLFAPGCCGPAAPDSTTCSTDTDCGDPSAARCLKTQAEIEGTCVECMSNADCDQGTTCDASLNVCR